jgi:hypothetical protein
LQKQQVSGGNTTRSSVSRRGGTRLFGRVHSLHGCRVHADAEHDERLRQGARSRVIWQGRQSGRRTQKQPAVSSACSMAPITQKCRQRPAGRGLRSRASAGSDLRAVLFRAAGGRPSSATGTPSAPPPSTGGSSSRRGARQWRRSAAWRSTEYPPSRGGRRRRAPVVSDKLLRKAGE